jgi:hypothetical protein
MRRTVFALLAVGGLTVPGGARAQTYIPVDLSPHVNSRIQTLAGAANQYPEGPTVLGGVPFDIPAGGNNAWDARFAGTTNPRVLTIPVNIPNATRVETLVNTIWGETGAGTFASVTFTGSAGASYTLDLDGNVHVRDYLLNTFTNTINGTTTTNVFRAGSGQDNLVRLDKQSIDLPVEFDTQTLTAITFTDNGAGNFQRLLVTGVTVQPVPEPVGLAVAASAPAAGYVVRRRVTAGGTCPPPPAN